MSTSDRKAALGAAIRAAREDAGITQEAAAHEAGVTVGTWSQLERGKSDPRFSTLVAVAAALGIKTSELVRRAEQKR